MSKKKDDPTVIVEQHQNSNTEINTKETCSFVESLLERFQQGAYAILEATRLVNAKDKQSELDLILNDEKHSLEYEAKQQFPFLK